MSYTELKKYSKSGLWPLCDKGEAKFSLSRDMQRKRWRRKESGSIAESKGVGGKPSLLIEIVQSKTENCI